MYSWSLLYTQILTQVTYFVHQQYLKLHQGYSFPITLYVPDCTQLSDTGVLILYSFMRVPLPAKSCNLHTYKRWYNGFLCAPQISNFIQGGAMDDRQYWHRSKFLPGCTNCLTSGTASRVATQSRHMVILVRIPPFYCLFWSCTNMSKAVIKWMINCPFERTGRTPATSIVLPNSSIKFVWRYFKKPFAPNNARWWVCSITMIQSQHIKTLSLVRDIVRLTSRNTKAKLSAIFDTEFFK